MTNVFRFLKQMVYSHPTTPGQKYKDVPPPTPGVQSFVPVPMFQPPAYMPAGTPNRKQISSFEPPLGISPTYASQASPGVVTGTTYSQGLIPEDYVNDKVGIAD